MKRLAALAVACALLMPTPAHADSGVAYSPFTAADRPVMLEIAYRESRFQNDAENPTSGAAGWWQILRTTWAGAAEIRTAQGLYTPAFDDAKFDPYWNAEVAATLLYYTPQGVAHWDASAGGAQ